MRYQSARQMVFDAYGTMGDSTLAGAIERAKLGRDIQTTQRQTQDSRIAHGLEAGAVISRVEAQPAHLQALLRICFGPFTRDELVDDGRAVVTALLRQATASQLAMPAGGDVVQLHCMCRAAVYHHAETTWPYRRQGLPTPQSVRSWVSDRCGHTLMGRWRQAGRPAWHHIWEYCLQLLDDWEKQGLAPVAALLEEDREARKAPAGAEA